MKPIFKKNKITFGFLSYSFIMGVSYDKPYLFIALGFFYFEINFLYKKPKPTPKSKHPNADKYNYF